ncbi:MAG: hypothetical protein R6V04_05190 [bacterium]
MNGITEFIEEDTETQRLKIQDIRYKKQGCKDARMQELENVSVQRFVVIDEYYVIESGYRSNWRRKNGALG